MSKLFKRKGFRMASVAYFLSLGTLAVSLFAWFSTSSTFSWFSQNKQVNADGMAIQIKTEENVSIQMDIYKYIENTKTETVTSADGTTTTQEVGTGEYHVQQRSNTNNYPLALARYDRVFKEDNVYSPVLFKLTLTGGMYQDDEILPLKIHHDATKDSTIIADSSGTATGAVDGTTYRLSSYISSVISIKAMVYNDSITWDSTDTAYESEADKIFQTMRTKFEATENVEYENQFFVTGLEDGKAATKTEYAAFENLKYKETTGTPANVKCCILYIWINYDESATYYGSDASSESSQNGLINAYIQQMMDAGSTTGINVSYPLYSDIDELSIIRTSSND